MTLSGRVFEVIPGGRVPAPGIGVTAFVVTPSACSPPCSQTFTSHGTTSGPDGRYQFPKLPAGSAIVVTSSDAHQQVCGAATVLSAATELDVEITSRSNPQPSPTMAPLRITGRIFETTPSGRVGVDGASIYIDWLAPDSPFMTIYADREGRFTACGIPANTQLGFWTSKAGYDDPYAWHQFSADTGAVDIELKRK